MKGISRLQLLAAPYVGLVVTATAPSWEFDAMSSGRVPVNRATTKLTPGGGTGSSNPAPSRGESYKLDHWVSSEDRDGQGRSGNFDARLFRNYQTSLLPPLPCERFVRLH
jgi:hypothetical protein